MGQEAGTAVGCVGANNRAPSRALVPKKGLNAAEW